MVKKLTSLLKNEIGWRLALKASASTFALALVHFSKSPLPGTVIFIVTSVLIYFISSPDQKLFRNSFILVGILGFLGARFIDAPTPFILGLLFFGATIFFILGLSTHFFKDRARTYGLLNTAIILGWFMFIFEANIFSELLHLLIPITFLVLFALSFEMVHVFGVAAGNRSAIFSASLALLGAEISFLLTFLPLGSVNAAALGTLLFIIVREGMTAYFSGVFSLNIALRQLAFFLLFIVLIFATSKWSFWAL